jgi:signal transduction histidine kinase
MWRLAHSRHKRLEQAARTVYHLVAGDGLWDHRDVPPTVAYPSDALASPESRRWLAVLLVAVAVALGVVAYRAQIRASSPHTWAAASVAIGCSFVLAGVAAWLRRPANRLGPLMLAAGLAYLARQLRFSENALPFTVFFLLADLSFALVGHSVLAYPSGRVAGRWSRRLVVVGYATVIAFPLGILLLHGTGQLTSPFPQRSLLSVADNAHAVKLLQRTETAVFYGLLACLFIVAIGGRLLRATPRARRMLAPLLLAAVALALRSAYECFRTFVNQQPLAYPYLFWWQVVAFIALPLALLAGMLRARLARANVSELVVALDRAPATPQTLREELGRALADPSLELYFWLPERGEFVDPSGVAVSLPSEDGGRAVTTLQHEDEPLAAILYDPSLLDEPELVEAAGAAARLALENARLHAQTRAQLLQVRESRRRIASAADDERRRIERNLHDGAQNRLLALALELSAAQRRLGTEADPEVERLLAASVEELQSTVEELRTLARGLHPTVLTEYGLSAALEALTHRSPVPVRLDILDERLPAQVEAAAYFVASEALSNVVKHADAERASIGARREGRWLVVDVADDGRGGPAQEAARACRASPTGSRRSGGSSGSTAGRTERESGRRSRACRSRRRFAAAAGGSCARPGGERY